MNREAAIGEWRRSQESLGAAETLMRSGYASDAVSRAYYAIMAVDFRRECKGTRVRAGEPVESGLASATGRDGLGAPAVLGERALPTVPKG